MDESESGRSAYLIIVSSIPSLYRSWRDSPNEVAKGFNRVLLDKAIEWVEGYQRHVLMTVPGDFSEYR